MPEPAYALVVAAHPDDAEFSVAGTVARWVKEGKDVVYVVCTNGDKGTSDPDMKSGALTKVSCARADITDSQFKETNHERDCWWHKHQQEQMPKLKLKGSPSAAGMRDPSGIRLDPAVVDLRLAHSRMLLCQW